jgi:Plavaka transposase
VTKEEVLHSLKRMLMGIADTSCVRKAGNLIKSLRHKSLDLTWLRASVDSIVQLREEARDEAHRCLAALDFVETTVRDPEDANCSGVAWFRHPVSILKRQFSKAGAGEVRYDPFIERNRMGTRVYNHAMGCDLADACVPLIRESLIGGMSGEFWIHTISCVAGMQAYSDKSSQSLKAGSKSFLPLHLTPLNLTQGLRQNLTANGDTIVAYLPVDLVKADDQ